MVSVTMIKTSTRSLLWNLVVDICAMNNQLKSFNCRKIQICEIWKLLVIICFAMSLFCWLHSKEISSLTHQVHTGNRPYIYNHPRLSPFKILHIDGHPHPPRDFTTHLCSQGNSYSPTNLANCILGNVGRSWWGQRNPCRQEENMKTPHCRQSRPGLNPSHWSYEAYCPQLLLVTSHKNSITMPTSTLFFLSLESGIQRKAWQ